MIREDRSISSNLVLFLSNSGLGLAWNNWFNLGVIYIPKYMKQVEDNLNGKGLRWSGGCFKLPRGIATDLGKLTLYPEKAAYWTIIWRRQGTDTEGFNINSNTSSAYNEILWAFSPTSSPAIKGSRLIASAKSSIATANKSGGRWQPYLLPLWTTKFVYLSPLVRTAAIGSVFRTFTDLTKQITSAEPIMSKKINKTIQGGRKLLQHLGISQDRLFPAVQITG